MMAFHISKIETNRALLLVSGELVNMERFVLKYSCEEHCVGRQVSLYLLTEAGVVCRLQIRIILYWPVHRMAVGQVQQVAKPAAGAVPPLIADAVLQDDVVGAEGAQQAVHVLGRPLRIDLVNLQNGVGGTALRGQPVRRLPRGSNLSPAPSHAGHPLRSASVWGKCRRNTDVRTVSGMASQPC